MTTIRSFRDLEAWQIAMQTAVATYRLTLLLPASERFELARQMQRAATSVPSNLAEGQARNSPKSFLHFLGIALGSTAELDTQIELCLRLKYLRPENTAELCELLESLRRLLYGLRRAKRRELAASAGRAAVAILLAVSFCAQAIHLF